jgi:hypothetical protein
VLSLIAIVCLPSLRPIYRLVVNGSLKSTQKSGGYSTSWNDRSGHQTLNSLKKDYSDSTRQLADMDADGNRSFTEALDATSRGSDTICEMDNLSPRQMPDGRVIMVKSEVGVKSSVRNYPAGAGPGVPIRQPIL